MNNKVRFGSWEAIILMVNFVFAQVILLFPKDMVIGGGSAGWIIPIIITLVSLIYFSIAAALYKNIGSLDLLDISYKVGGRILKVIVGLTIMLVLLLTTSIYLGGFSQTLKIVSLDNSPLEYLMLFFFVGMVVAAFYGVEAIVRVNAVLIPIVIVGFILITIGVIPNFKTSNLFPILGNGMVPIAKSSLYKLSTFSFFLILFLMVPYFRKQNLKKVGFSYVLISGVLLLWSTLSFILLFPQDVAVDKKVPLYQMARNIEFGNYVQRVESIFVLLCSISLLLFSSIVFVFTVEVLTKTLDLTYTKPLILPIGLLVIFLSLIIKRMNIDIISNNTFGVIWLIGMVLPLIIVIIGAIKKVGINEEESK